jgi:hypothetical protein
MELQEKQILKKRNRKNNFGKFLERSREQLEKDWRPHP